MYKFKWFLTCFLFAHSYSFCLADTATVNFTGNVKKAVCTLNSDTYNINLGDWSTSDFTSIGSTTTSTALDIVLNCPSSDIAVTAEIIGTADTTQSGTISLTSSANSASGIGIQILDEASSPLTINSPFLIENSISNQKMNLAWKARYIQTSNTVSEGTANGLINVSFTYN
ncbi:fimbrial protein [Enterobacter huaxiensis]|uniref:fimbrial protein n=1 Tax=Enterobacter huaxiensis TaxID=2494702 RepID=UPI000E764821|nr:fimbrial protein [Enterobacter huaxiensis]